MVFSRLSVGVCLELVTQDGDGTSTKSDGQKETQKIIGILELSCSTWALGFGITNRSQERRVTKDKMEFLDKLHKLIKAADQLLSDRQETSTDWWSRLGNIIYEITRTWERNQ